MIAAATLENHATKQESAYEATPSLYSRARDAAARYLELRGYEVLERDWPTDSGIVDIIAREDDTIVFVEVQTAIGQFPDALAEPGRRSLLEAMAIAYLGENDLVDVQVRFDTMCLVPVGANRAFLRHQINVLGQM